MSGDDEVGGGGETSVDVRAPQPVSCAWCGTVAPDGPPVTWSVQNGERPGRGPEHLCERCTRDNLRSIEGRLGSDWW